MKYLNDQPFSWQSFLSHAANSQASHAVIICDNELAKGVATIRDLGRSEQAEVPIDNIADHLRIQGED